MSQSDPNTNAATTPSAEASGGWRRVLGTLIAVFVLVASVWAVDATRRRIDRSPVSDDAVVVADTVGIVPRVSGPIVRLKVKEGERVVPGQLLFQIDPRPLDLAVQAAEAALGTIDAQIAIEAARAAQLQLTAAAAEAQIEAARAILIQRRRTVERLTPLTEQGYSPAEVLDEAIAALRVAEAELAAAGAEAEATTDARSELEALRARRRELEIDLEIARLERSHCDVKAPIGGVVISLDLAIGSFARPGLEVFQMVADDSVHVEAQFPEGRLGSIRPGDRAQIRVMTAPDRVFEGRVLSIGAGVRPSDELVIDGIPFVRRELDWVRIAQKFPVRIEVEDVDPDLFRMGGSATVAIEPTGGD